MSKKLALFIALITFNTAQAIEYSAEKTVQFKDTARNGGTMKLSYSTYMDGVTDLWLGYIKGKIELEDNSKSTWDDDNHLRLCMEFGLPAKVKDHREKIRITKVIKESWDEVIEGSKEFKAEDKDWHHRFCRNE